MVRLVCTSDTHCKHKQVKIPEGDILIHAGDLTPRGSYYEFKSVGNWFESLKPKFKHIIVIAGNHDWGFYFNPKVILEDHFNGCVNYLQDDPIELEGIKFYGTPWCPEFYNWAFMEPDEELEKRWAKIPDDTEVLITHTPPYGILDCERTKTRAGSFSLLQRVKQLPRLKHHIFGHIHEGYGSTIEDGIEFHNVAALNGEYQYQNPPKVIDL